MKQSSFGHAIPMEPDHAFRVISNSRRRSVIFSLAQSEDVLSVTDLTIEVSTVCFKPSGEAV
jgi:hypothetical protein